jgi:hypothetical protein
MRSCCPPSHILLPRFTRSLRPMRRRPRSADGRWSRLVAGRMPQAGAAAQAASGSTPWRHRHGGRLDIGGRLIDGGQVDAEQLRAPLQRRRDRPGHLWVVPGPHPSRLSNTCSRSHRQCYRPQPDGSLGHIGGTDHRSARVNSGQSG